MSWPAPGHDPVVRTIILDDTTAAKIAAQRWASEKDAKIGAGVWMWWADRTRSDDGPVGAAALCKHRNGRRSHHSALVTGRRKVIDTGLWAIGLALVVAIGKIETLHKYGMKTVAILIDSKATIRRVTHLEPGPGH
jgi:hypothetical protein